MMWLLSLTLSLATARSSLRLFPESNGQDQLTVTPPQLHQLLVSQLSIDSHFSLDSDSSFLSTLNTFKLSQLSNPQPDNLLLVACYNQQDCMNGQAQVELEQNVKTAGYDALIATYLTNLGQDGWSVDGFKEFARAVESEVGTKVEWDSKLLSHDWRTVMEEMKPAQILDLFSVSDESAKPFLQEFSQLDKLVESLFTSTRTVTALRLTGLSSLANSYGTSSPQYQTAHQLLSAVLQQLVNTPGLQTTYLHVPPSEAPLAKRSETSLLATFHISSVQMSKKRAPEDTLPLVSSSRKCFKSLDVCEDESYNCNGRGSCVKGQALRTLQKDEECWVCACGATKEGEGNAVRTSYWAGETCEKEDYSSDFLLLFGSSIALILVLVVSVGILASVGGSELPSQLASVGGAAMKRD